MDTLPDELLERVLALARPRPDAWRYAWRYADVSRRFHRLVAGARKGSPLYYEHSLATYCVLVNRYRFDREAYYGLSRLRRDLASLAAARLGPALLSRLSLVLDFSYIDSSRLALTRWTREERDTLRALGGVAVKFSWQRALRGPWHHDRAWTHPLGWLDADEREATRFALETARAMFSPVARMRALKIVAPGELDARHCIGYEEYDVEMDGGGGEITNLDALRSARQVAVCGGDEAWAVPLYGGPRLRGFAGELERAACADDVAAARAFVLRYGAAPLKRGQHGTASIGTREYARDTWSFLSQLLLRYGNSVGDSVARFLVVECGCRMTHSDSDAIVYVDVMCSAVHLREPLLRLLLEHGGLAPSVDHVYVSNEQCAYTAVYDATVRGENFALVLEHTRSRAVLDARCGIEKNTALHVALASIFDDATGAARIAALAARGASPSIVNGARAGIPMRTPLVVAVLRARPLCVRALLAAGASPLEHASSGRTALYLACENQRFGDSDLVAFFDALPGGAPTASDGRTLLHAVASTDWRPDLAHGAMTRARKAVYLMTSQGIDPRVRDAHGKLAVDTCAAASPLRHVLQARSIFLDAKDADAAGALVQ